MVGPRSYNPPSRHFRGYLVLVDFTNYNPTMIMGGGTCPSKGSIILKLSLIFDYYQKQQI